MDRKNINSSLIIIDEKLPTAIFPNPNVSRNSSVGVEYILERNKRFTRGIFLRKMNGSQGVFLWVGEYNNCKVVRFETVPEPSIEIMKSSIEDLKHTLESKIVSNFCYGDCPNARKTWCQSVDRIFQKYSESGKSEINYLDMGDIISHTEKCRDVLSCPLRKSNSMDAVLGLGEMLGYIGMKMDLADGLYKIHIIPKE